ncbi:autotransporter outer membrane beta-barrel domain-containing protein, partial [Rhodopseudomonas palustris]
RHNFASSYITATAAYGWQDISTDRMITAVGTEQLRANFNANAYSGRIEAGHRWEVAELGGIGLTPYAAIQVTAFDLPAYAEKSQNGAGGFALNYSAETATAARTELGLRSDKSWAMAGGLLTLRGRAAWAHDDHSDRNVSAVFQSLPGSTFTVNGARAARNAALTSASAEMSFNGGWSVAA